MALIKPVLSSVAAFDATKSMTFNFVANGGDPFVGSKLTVKLNDTGAVVYSNTISSTSPKYVLPANSLTNGNYYVASIQTVDEDDNYSMASNSIQFWCYTTPVIVFTNIPAGGIVEASSYNFKATYTQLQGELLSSYGFLLYDSNDNLIKSIDGDNRIYVYDTIPPPTYLNYTFTGLEDNTTYKIQAVGYTSQNTVVYSNKETFNVKYGSSQFTSVIKLTNNCKDGTIYIESQIHDLEGESTNGDIEYLTEGSVTAADLRNNGAIWDDQLSFNENYTVYITGRDFNNNTCICQLGDRTGLYYREFYDDLTEEDLCHIELLNRFDSDGIYYYRIYSNDIPKPLETDYLVIQMICGNDMMDIRIENIGGAS